MEAGFSFGTKFHVHIIGLHQLINNPEATKFGHKGMWYFYDTGVDLIILLRAKANEQK